VRVWSASGAILTIKGGAAGPTKRERICFRGYESSGFFGIVAPAKTPSVIVDKLNNQCGARQARRNRRD
jgi:hypothetical protein